MFDDINLLPEDLRNRERKEKEKIEKSGGFSNGELSYPSLRNKKGNGFDFKAINKKEKEVEWEVKEGRPGKDKPGFIDKKEKKLWPARKLDLFDKIKKIFIKRKKAKPDLEKIKEERSTAPREEFLEPKIVKEARSEEALSSRKKESSQTRKLSFLEKFFKREKKIKKEIKPALKKEEAKLILPREEIKELKKDRQEELVAPGEKIGRQEKSIDLKSTFQKDQSVDWTEEGGKIKKEEIVPQKKKAYSWPGLGIKINFNLFKFFNFLKPKPRDINPGAVSRNGKEPKIVPGLSSGDNLNAPSDSLEVNLVPSGHDFLPLPKIVSYFILTIIINLVIVGVLYGAVVLYNYKIQLKSDVQDQRIAEKIKEIEKLKTKESEAESLISEVEQVEDILNKHVYWTKFFSTLENYTLDNVYFTNFAATKEGDINLSAVTSDYLSVAKQLIVLEDSENFIKNVEITSASKSLATEGTPSKVSFNIGLTLDPQVFLMPLENE